MCTWRSRCGAGRALKRCASGFCRSERSASPGPRWRPCWWRRGSASHPVNCTLPRTGTVVRHLPILASAGNLAWLRQTGRRYIIGAAKSELKKFGSELARADGWRTIQEGVEVKLTSHPETGDTVVLCRSEDRRSKEQAMHHKFSRRIEAALDRLATRVARSKKRLDPAAVDRQIGRILQQNQRAAARFTVTLQPDGCPAGFRLAVAYNAAFDDWATLSEGAYLLRSNISDWSDRQLWKAYIQLTQAEAAFRIQKDQLNVRPIWHQRQDRVQAHILVCFLAFVLWKSLEM